jgi:hypothetical protein
MKNKENTQRQIRGWLPKDSVSSLNAGTLEIENPSVNEAQRKIFKRIRFFNLSMFCVFLATYFLIGPAMKSGEIVSACLIALFLSLIAVNTFLLDKVNKTAETIKG